MKTYSPRKADIVSDWHVIDAEGETLGRLASRAAQMLSGKTKTIYARHMDVGDHVVIVNAEKIAVSGQKVTQKIYYHHSGYPGGLKEATFEQVLKKRPERIIEHAIKGMLPKTALGRAMYKKLRVYKGPNHPHAGQLRPSAPSTRE